MGFKKKYPKIFSGGFPNPVKNAKPSFHAPIEFSFNNFLRKNKPRLLFIVPSLASSSADRFNAQVLELLVHHGWEVTIVTTNVESSNAKYAAFAKFTPDIFLLSNYVTMQDMPRMLLYLITSRRPDVVLVSQSEFAYQMLPILKSQYPNPLYFDYNHVVEPTWQNGGFPRYSYTYKDQLDMHITASKHLKDWLVQHGTNAHITKTCHVNVDTKKIRRNERARTAIRKKHAVPSNAVVILYNEKMIEQEQTQVLLHVLKQLNDVKMPFFAFVAGDGPEMKRVEQFLDQHQLKTNIVLLGNLGMLYSVDLFTNCRCIRSIRLPFCK